MKFSIINLAHRIQILLAITGAGIFILVLTTCTPLTASPVPVSTIMTPNPIIFSSTPLTPTPAPTGTTTTVPTATMTATPTPTSTSTPTPTEIPKLVLSADAANPTRLEWSLLFGENKLDLVAGDGVKLSGKGLWDQVPDNWKNTKGADKGNMLPGWRDPQRNFVTMNEIPSVIWEKSTHIDGFAQTTAPNGEKWLVMQESVISLDGNVVKWKFVFPADNQYTKKYWDVWFRGKLDKKLFFMMPMTFTSEKHQCFGTVSAFMCDNVKLENSKYMEKFLETGNIPAEMGDGWQIPEPVPQK